MNEELIDEIAFLAGCHRHTYCDPKNPDLGGYIINRDVLDKFAELIVRECIDNVPWQYENKIKEHFGVE